MTSSLSLAITEPNLGQVDKLDAVDPGSPLLLGSF